MQRLAAILVVLAVVVPAAASAQEAAPKTAPAPVSKRDRERRAESAFVAGRYQEAAELLNGLYVEFHNPVYLRNLGRCYQRVKDPDRAIAAFDEYLKRGKGITAAERDEVNGFIKEMEELKKQQQVAAAPPPPPPPPLTTPAPPVAITPPSVLAPAVAPVQTVETRPAASSHRNGKLIGGILLGAGALLAAGGGYMLNSSWTEFHRGERIGCPGVFDCPQIADKVASRALVGKILFGAAAAAGIAGGTVLVLSLSGGSETAGTGMTVAVRGRF